MLRARLVDRGTAREPGVEVASRPAWRWLTVDLTDLDQDHRAAAIDELYRQIAASRPSDMDPEEGSSVLDLVHVTGGGERLVASAPAWVVDALGLRYLLRELLDAAARGDGLPEDGDAPIQYPDAADVLNGLLESPETAQGRAFWSRRELTVQPAEPLGFAPPDDGPPGSWVPATGPVVRLGRKLAKDVLYLAEAVDATPEDVLLAAWAVLLGRHQGRERLVLGVELSGRTHEGLEEIPGPLSRTLPFSVALDGIRFSELVQGLASRREELDPWQDYYDREALYGAASKTIEPPLPFVFRALPPWRAPAGSNEAELERETAVCELFRLALTCRALSDGDWELTLGRDPGFCSGVEGAALLRRLETLMGRVLAAPETPVETLEALTDQELVELLRRGTGASTTVPPTPSVHGMIAERAEETPDAVAVAFGDERVTYRGLRRAAVRLSGHLAVLGVGPEERVGILLDRSPNLIVALLAVLEAGGAYVPIDRFHPPGRRTAMLEDAGARFLITRGDDVDGAPEGVEAVDLDRLVPCGRDQPAGADAGRVGGGHLAYVLYTSGSTGRPKGVAVSHGALVDYLEWCRTAYGLGPGGCVPVHSPVGFDLTLTGLLAPLAAGGTVELLPEEDGDVQPLADRLASGRPCALVKVTPAHLDVLGDLVERMDAPLQVSTLVVGGEPLRGEALRLWTRLAPETLVVNEYGPTEAVVGCTVHRVRAGRVSGGPVPIGGPIDRARVMVTDGGLRPVPPGIPGELCVGGPGLARGYLGRPGATAARFVPDPWSDRPGARIYRTGDLVRWSDGELRFLGRTDRQTKIRGVRIDPAEVEAVLARHPAVREVAVSPSPTRTGDLRLVAHVAADPEAYDREGLVELAHRFLPDPMVPTAWVRRPRLPKTRNGKVDRAALRAWEPGAVDGATVPRTELEGDIVAVWREVLGLEEVGRRENFFDLGGHSMLLAQVRRRLARRLGREIEMVDLFRYPTVESLARFLGPHESETVRRARIRSSYGEREPVAVVGMSGRFPGAPDLARFWDNLWQGVESISRFTPQELRAAGVPERVFAHPDYVPARGALEGGELFDAEFFGIGAREAELTDPQHRVFLECAWQALEDAGYDPERIDGPVGVFGGASLSNHLRDLIRVGPELLETVGGFQAVTGADKDFLATRVSYKLGLRGPGVTVQTACSTSLVAVHLACRSLREGESDLALAGGVSVRLPGVSGYRYREGGIASPDGHCRAFDARAAGTLGGDGVGVVVLKRLRDAEAAGDTIRAVILGTAINNDGAEKVGYTAPGVRGQSEVIRAALADAGAEGRSISYVEAHGTGTALGDPIEVAALTEALGDAQERRGPCALGSVKTNIGHLDAAAGIAGLIKTVLALERRSLPPSLHYSEPNPEIDFEAGPFRVQAEPAPWNVQEGRRRAGVSSFGIGGTNAHAVLEEAPDPESTPTARTWQLMPLSARTAEALDEAARRLAVHLEREDATGPPAELADVAYTLQVGRARFPHRRVAVCAGVGEAVQMLGGDGAGRIHGGVSADRTPPVVFLFPGQGSQHPGMGRELYRTEPVFRDQVDRCCELVEPGIGAALRDLFTDGNVGATQTARTALAQPALFTLEYSLARLWMEWGVTPRAVVGHSLGEYVAACLAGVFDLVDGLRLVTERGRLMDALPEGAMLGVPLPEDRVRELLAGRDGLSLAAVNGPEHCAVSGPAGEVEALEAELDDRGIPAWRLQTSHAFHSPMMEPAVGPLTEAVRRVELGAPDLPLWSNLTGERAEARLLTDPETWGRQLVSTVRFGDAVRELLAEGDAVFLEVGPGRALTSLVGGHPDRGEGQPAVASLPVASAEDDESAAVTEALGRLWVAGVEVDWDGFWGRERRRRVPLPTYPFERRPFRLPEPRRDAPTIADRSLVDWSYLPSWRRTPPVTPALPVEGGLGWLIFDDGSGLGEPLAERLRDRGCRAVLVLPGDGDGVERIGDDRFRVSRADGAGIRELVGRLLGGAARPGVICHLGGLSRNAGSGIAETVEEEGIFTGLVHLAGALAESGLSPPLRLMVVTDGLQSVTGEETLAPGKAWAVGLCRTLPAELPGLDCRSVDLGIDADEPSEDALDELIAEGESEDDASFVAYRGRGRWVEGFAPAPLPEARTGRGLLRSEGVYLITGGLGGMGLELALRLAREVRARLVLVGRTAPPPGRDREVEGQDDDPTRRQLGRLRAIEEAGGEVMTAAADVTDAEALAEVVARARRRFGAIHGVVHAAGVPPAGTLQRRAPEDLQRVMAPKLQGSLALTQVLPPQELDFLLLCSSLASISTQAGRVDYCAANAFLDRYAQALHDAGSGRVVSVSWDTWREAGMAFEETVRRGLDPRTAIRAGMSNDEGWEVFLRVLGSGLPHVVISVEDLESGVQRARLSTPGERDDVQAERAEGGLLPGHDRPALDTPYVAPRTEEERILAGVWSEILGIRDIGVDDDFFELGGDSVVAIQMISRCRNAGLTVTPKQVFELPTVALLAGAAGSGAEVRADQGAVVGEAPLTPIQRWFFEQDQPEPDHWNQAVLLETPSSPDPAAVGRAVAAVLEHHDALRHRFVRSDDAWRQRSEPPGGPVPFVCVDLESVPERCFSEAVETAAVRLHSSLDLERGPLMRAALFLAGGESRGRLLLIAHHLVVDAVAWRVLLEDLGTAVEAFESDRPVEFPAKTTSFLAWSRRLEEHARRQPPTDELDFWLEQQGGTSLPAELEGPNLVASVSTVTDRLDEDATRMLLHDLPASGSIQALDLLLAALVEAFARRGVGPPLTVDLEGHGREPVFDDVDVSRTVGWFTTLYPLRLGSAAAGGDLGALLRTVKEQVRRVPAGGFNYGLLRYLTPDPVAVRALRDLPNPEVSFLYLGRFERSGVAGTAYRPARERSGPSRSPETLRPHLLEVTASAVDGRLEVGWAYSRNAHRRSGIEALAREYIESLRALIDHCRAEGDPGYTPSDFTQADLSQDELDDLISELSEHAE